MSGNTSKQTKGNSALGFEATLWAADKLRGNLDAAAAKLARVAT